MKAILIMIILSGSMNQRESSIYHVPFKTMEACRAAERIYDKFPTPDRTTLWTFCHPND